MSENFRERNFGVFEGMDFDEFYGEICSRVGSKSLSDVLMYDDDESAESVSDVKTRALQGVQRILDTLNEGESALIASHGAFMIYLAMLIRDHFKCQMPDLGPAMKSPKNTALLQFSVDKKDLKFECEKFFSCDHL